MLVFSLKQVHFLKKKASKKFCAIEGSAKFQKLRYFAGFYFTKNWSFENCALLRGFALNWRLLLPGSTVPINIQLSHCFKKS